MFEKAQFTLVNEHFEAIFDKDISSAAISRQRLFRVFKNRKGYITLAFIAVIFARGGSKGVPGKNIKPLGEKPLIAWSIELAQSVKSIERIFVSTDSQEIAAVALQYGAEVPFIRPSHLAADTSSEWLSWRHFIEYCHHNTIDITAMVSLPATSPFRTKKYLENCLASYTEHKPDAVISVTSARRHPAFNMVSLDGKRAALYDKSAQYTRRQAVPPAYDMSTAVYVVNPNFILQKEHLFDGHVVAEIADDFASIDIDTVFDFQVAQAIEPLWRSRCV